VIDRGATGDNAETFEEFFQANYRTLVKRARYVGASMEEAEDAASEAMLDVCKNWHRLEDPRAWSCRAVVRFYFKAKTRGLDRVRARQAREQTGTAWSSAHTNLTSWEEWQWIKQVLLDELTYEQREVVVLVMDGYGHIEIAEEIGLTPNAVRQRLSRARRPLKLMWDQRDDTGVPR
jgi:RNA polymerase sigma factor (sigma-70 family)